MLGALKSDCFRLKEGALFEKTAKEKQVLDEIQSRSDLQNLLSSIQVYQKKLVKIKANMRNLHERSTKLKVFKNNSKCFIFFIQHTVVLETCLIT